MLFQFDLMSAAIFVWYLGKAVCWHCVMAGFGVFQCCMFGKEIIFQEQYSGIG